MTVTNNIYQNITFGKKLLRAYIFVYITCRIEIKFYLLTKTDKISRIQCSYKFRVDQTCSGIYNTTCASDFR